MSEHYIMRKKGGDLRSLTVKEFEGEEPEIAIYSKNTPSTSSALRTSLKSSVTKLAAPSFRRGSIVSSPAEQPLSASPIASASPMTVQPLSSSPKIAQQVRRRGDMERQTATRRLSAGRHLRRRHSKPRHTVRRKRSHRK